MKKTKGRAKAVPTKAKKKSAPAPARVADQLRTKKAKRARKLVQKRKVTEKKAAAGWTKKGAAEAKGEQATLSQRQENFCVFMLEEKTATEAYRRAYGNTKSAEAASSRLLSSVKVQRRIAELRALAAAGAVLSLAEKRQFLRSVVMTALGDVDERSLMCQQAEYQVTGGIRGQLRRGAADRGNEEEEPEMTTVKIKMCDKLRAIELDAKLAGELRDQVEHKHGVDDGLAELLGAIRAGRGKDEG